LNNVFIINCLQDFYDSARGEICIFLDFSRIGIPNLLGFQARATFPEAWPTSHYQSGFDAQVGDSALIKLHPTRVCSTNLVQQTVLARIIG
jgi:hypothetical protein